ncbi:hypothetical protein SEA_SAPO_46 [Gordonia phage Sapo]|nr:hypothetical protein SEA_SAPO_46 [Gordonia phage Sapo]
METETWDPRLVSEGDVVAWGDDYRVVTEVTWFEVNRVGRVYRFQTRTLEGFPADRLDVRAGAQVEVVVG